MARFSNLDSFLFLARYNKMGFFTLMARYNHLVFFYALTFYYYTSNLPFCQVNVTFWKIWLD